MKFLKLMGGLLTLSIICSCSTFKGVDKQDQVMDPNKNYKRDMVMTVNGVTREGSITMPLKAVNKIHIYSRGDLDVFIMKSCGGVFTKEKAWNVVGEVKSGFFGWGSKKIEKKNEVEFTINATDFHDTGVCPLYLTGAALSGRNSDGYINWQTDKYKASGYVVCNMEKRSFDGVEACSSGTGSFTKLSFDEDMLVKTDAGKCEIKDKNGKVIEIVKDLEWQVVSGVCNYSFLSTKSDKKGFYHTYGEDEVIIRQ